MMRGQRCKGKVVERVGNLTYEEIAERLGTNEHEAPGLLQVLRQVPTGLAVIALQNFMSLPNSSLIVDGEALTPTTWLIERRDPEKVVALVVYLDLIP